MDQFEEEANDQHLQEQKRRRHRLLSLVGLSLLTLSICSLSSSFILFTSPNKSSNNITSHIPSIISNLTATAYANSTPTLQVSTPTATEAPPPTATAVANATATAQVSSNATATAAIATATSDPLVDKIVAYTPISHVQVIAAWSQMTINQSVDVSVSLTSQAHLPSIASFFVTPNGAPTEQIANAIPIGTPDVLLKNAYGSGYETFASAQLNGTAFDILPQDPQTQSLDQNVVSFHWSVLPKESGQQVIEVDITLQWKPENQNDTRDTIVRPFVQNPIYINVNNAPFIMLGQITIGELLLGLLGSVLNVPWILDYLQKRRKTKEEEKKAPPKKLSVSPTSQKRPKKKH